MKSADRSDFHSRSPPRPREPRAPRGVRPRRRPIDRRGGSTSSRRHRNRRERASRTPRGSSDACLTAATKRRLARTLWLQARRLRSSSLTSLAPPSRPSDSYDGFQGRFHLLLHLRVCQRGSPRQARRPGASPHAPLPASSRAHRTPSPAAESGELFFSAEQASGRKIWGQDAPARKNLARAPRGPTFPSIANEPN